MSVIHYFKVENTEGNILGHLKTPASLPAPDYGVGYTAVEPNTDELLTYQTAIRTSGYDPSSSNFSIKWKPGQPEGSRVEFIDSRPTVRLLEMPGETALPSLNEITRDITGANIEYGLEVVNASTGARLTGVNTSRDLQTKRGKIRLTVSSGLASFFISPQNTMDFYVSDNSEFKMWQGQSILFRVIGNIID